MNHQLPELAEDLGFRGSRFLIQGEIRGRQVKVDECRGGNLRRGRAHYAITIRLSPKIDFNLKIQPSGRYDKLAKAIGGQDIQLENARFDRNFTVRSSDPTALRNILSQELQQSLLHIRERYPQNFGRVLLNRKFLGLLKSHRLEYICDSLIYNEIDRLPVMAMAGYLCDLADAIEVYTGG